MKLSSLLCLVCLLIAQFGTADDITNSPYRGFQVPAAAQNAAEAPPWNPQAQPAVIQPPSAQSIPAATGPTVPTINNPVLGGQSQVPVINPAPAAATSPSFAAPPGVKSSNSDPRPLVSVMKRKTQSATTTVPAPGAPQTLAPSSGAVASSPATIPSTVPAAPATLSPAQTSGALPISSLPQLPTKVAAAATPSPATPSPVVAAEYDEPITNPPDNSATERFNPSGATTPLATAVKENSSDPTDNPVAPSPAAGNSRPLVERSASRASPLQPTKGPVQFVSPPGNSTSSAPAIPSVPAIVDPQVTPAITNSQATETAVDPEQQASARAAADLLVQSLITNSAAELPGQWEPLATAISGLDEHQRLAAVSDYWRLSHAVSDYIWTSDELQRLEKAVPSRVLVDNPMISTARAIATARIHEAELSVTKAQQSLISLGSVPQSNVSAGILPSDHPLAGPYHTYFQAIFADRPAPGRTREIDAALPIHFKIIAAHAAAVRSAMDAVHYAEEAHARGETDVRTVLACHEDLHNQRRDFLNAVLNYNLDIAEYAAAVAAPGTPHDKFVAMLIRPKPAERLSAIPERSTFGTPASPFTSGSMESELFAPRINNTRETNPKGASNHSAADAWVPSTLRPIEAGPPPAVEEPRAATQPPVVNPVNPLGKQADPFAPSVGDRYGNRYNEGR